MIGFAGIWNPEGDWNKANPAALDQMMRELEGHQHATQRVHSFDVQGKTIARIAFYDTVIQPIVLESDSTALISYGSIYNEEGQSAALKNCLELAERNPQDAFLSLNGDFTLFLFQKHTGDLRLFRDRGGVRHVFYHAFSGGVVFSSGLRAIAKSARYPTKRPNYEAIWLNMAYPAPPQPLTCFEDIHCLERGTELHITDQGARTQRAWSIPFDRQQEHLSMQESVDGIHEALDNSVRRRSRESNKLASTLSGGVDSAYLTVLAHRHQPSTEAVTFKVKGADFDHLNEDDVASLTAKKYGIQHHIHAFEFEEFFDELNLLVRLYEQPGLSLGAYFAIAQMTNNLGHDQLINGLGADELHGGFHYFKHLGYWRWLRLLNPIARLAPLNRHKGIDKFKRIAGAKDIHAYYSLAFAQHLDQEIAQMMPGHRVDSTRVQEKLYGPGAPFRDDISGLMHYMFSNCPNHHLYRFETFCAHFGIKAIYPFLDNDVIDFSWRVPSAHKVVGHKRKIALKKAAEPWVVKPALTEAKRGVGAPVNHWINNKLEEITLEKLDRLKQREAFSAKYIDEVAKNHRSGYGKKAWKLVMTELWFEEFID